MLMLFRAADEGVDEGVVRGASMLEKFPPFSFAIDEEKIGNETPWESIVFNRPAPAPHWSNYVKGAVSFARWKHGARVARGFNFLIESSIPPNSGASSSSALVTLAGAAIREANHLKAELKELALDSSQAEWFIGTRGGALDHLAICLATRGNAIYISHSDRYTEPVPMPGAGYRWITFFSHEADKGRELMLEYNERVAVSRLIIPALLQDPKAGELPETMTLDEFERGYPQAFRECEREFPNLVRERRARPLKLSDRSKHHSQESVRVKLMARLFFTDHLKDDERMREIGDALNQSHASLRDYYDVSTPEVERLVEIITADSLVYGARLMGGGFGGNILALTTAENTQALINRAQNEFYAPRGRDGIGEGSVMVSTPGNGLEFLN
jgi:galactokinase